MCYLPVDAESAASTTTVWRPWLVSDDVSCFECGGGGLIGLSMSIAQIRARQNSCVTSGQRRLREGVLVSRI